MADEQPPPQPPSQSDYFNNHHGILKQKGNRSASMPMSAAPPRPGSDLAAHSRPTERRLSVIPYDVRTNRSHEWTVFGQLLQDVHARPPGQAGSSASSFRPSQFSGGPSRLLGAVVEEEVESPPLGASPMPMIDDLVDEPAPGRSRAASLTTMASTVNHLDNTDTDVDEQDPSPPPTLWQRATSHLPAMTPLRKNILKCAVAYFLGSLFTYWPLLSGLLSDIVPLNSQQGPSPAGHMVATVTVYYNPAQTIGAMFEADTYCLIGVLYSAVVCLLSMGLFWLFEERKGLEFLADASVFICIALAMTGIAWSKLRMERPTFNTACSMTAIIIFIVVVKEGGVETMIHVLFIVLIGSLISNIVCFGLWRQSATTRLQNNISTVLDSFSAMLDITTETFLLQNNLERTQSQILAAAQEHQASFTSLKKSLIEARSEWCDPRMRAASSPRRGHEVDLYDAAVDGLTRLAQHLNGLRDGTRQQLDVFAKEKDAGTKGKSGHGVVEKSTASETLRELLEDMAPPMSALANSCIACLQSSSAAFKTTSGKNTPPVKVDFRSLTANIRRALYTFEHTSNQAVLRFFRRADEGEKSDKDLAANHLNDLEGSDVVFLVYFYTFTLQEYARELANVTGVLSEIHHLQNPPQTMPIKRGLFHWLTWPFACCAAVAHADEESDTLLPVENPVPRKTLTRRISSLAPESKTSFIETFPAVRPHAPNTMQTPSPKLLSWGQRINQALWRIGGRLRETDLKYSIKCGLATAILAGPSFIDSTRPLFVEWKGEWALITCFVVLSPTVGQTNFLSVHRVLGTLFGAATAVGIYTLFPHNPYVLSVFGAIFSMPCFYYIVGQPKYATTGRFVLLTYNLTALYCYNARDTGEADIVNIAFHRSAAVTVGVTWAFIVSRWWWPIEARRELSKGLSEFVLSLGWLYTRLVQKYSVPPERLERLAVPRQGNTLQAYGFTEGHLTNSIRQFMSMELHLQLQLIKLQSLLAQTAHEPRLKGPFPVHLYRTILTSLQVILDKLHLMRCVTTKEEWYTSVRQDFIIPVNRQRRDMVGNVMLYFSTLSSGFTLKRALPPYLPPAEEARQLLVRGIRELDAIKKRDVKHSEQLLFFAYALMMKGVIAELEFLGATLQDAFGVIGGSVDSFERFFSEV